MSYYQPLNDDQLRLLWFLDDSGLCCKLQTHSKQELPPYTALSYTWELDGLYLGSQNFSILLDGEHLVIKRNLHNALRQLAPILRAQGYPLWVDAICINQNDVNERNAQVKKMKAIYEDAIEIYAWLGVPANEERTRQAVDLIHQISQNARQLRQSSGSAAGYVDAINERHVLFPSPARRDICNAWDGIAEMLLNRYWQRTWISQEATTPTSLKFYCGQHSFKFLSLFDTINLSGIFSKLPASRGIPSLREVTENKTIIGLLLGWFARTAQTRRELLDLIVGSRLTICADPRDKVFAAWGHAVDVSEQDIIMVDYTESTCNVFINIVWHVLNTSPARIWEVLGYVVLPIPTSRSEYLQEQFTESPLPSWVPDWRRRVLITPIAARQPDDSPLYNPWFGTRIDARITGEGFKSTGITTKTLKIEFLTTYWENTDPNFVEGQQARWRDAVLRSGLIDGIELDSMWGRTLVGDRTIALDVQETGTWLPPHRRLSDSEINVDDEHIRIAQFCYGRKMGVLSNRKIGLFPATTETGDSIVVFSGGGALHVVRPLADHLGRYSFIGECYIDGMMDGALIQKEMDYGNVPVNLLLV